jgi:hypothetical protein
MRRRRGSSLARPLFHPGRKALAYHEAGHAVVGYVLGLEIERLTIVRSETCLGRCFYREWDDSEAAHDPERRLLLFLAGPIAEEIATATLSRALDERRALDLARAGARSDADAARVVAGARSSLGRFLASRWPAVQAVAVALRKDRELDGARTMHLITRAFRAMGGLVPQKRPVFAPQPDTQLAAHQPAAGADAVARGSVYVTDEGDTEPETRGESRSATRSVRPPAG